MASIGVVQAMSWDFRFVDMDDMMTSSDMCHILLHGHGAHCPVFFLTVPGTGL